MWTLAAWRLNRVGVWMSARGVRSRLWLSTSTFPWVDITGFDTGPGFVGARVVRLVLKDGSTVDTAVRFHNPRVPGVFPALTVATTVTPSEDQVDWMLRRLERGLSTYS